MTDGIRVHAKDITGERPARVPIGPVQIRARPPITTLVNRVLTRGCAPDAFLTHPSSTTQVEPRMSRWMLTRP